MSKPLERLSVVVSWISSVSKGPAPNERTEVSEILLMVPTEVNVPAKPTNTSAVSRTPLARLPPVTSITDAGPPKARPNVSSTELPRPISKNVGRPPAPIEPAPRALSGLSRLSVVPRFAMALSSSYVMAVAKKLSNPPGPAVTVAACAATGAVINAAATTKHLNIVIMSNLCFCDLVTIEIRVLTGCSQV